MAYNTFADFNYTPQAASSFTPSQEFQDFSRWLAQQGIDMFNLARADRNTQLDIANKFQQQQADRMNALQQAQLGMNQQAQAAQLAIANQNAADQRMANANSIVAGAFSNPAFKDFLQRQAEWEKPTQTPWGQPIYYGSGSFIRGGRPGIK